MEALYGDLPQNAPAEALIGQLLRRFLVKAFFSRQFLKGNFQGTYRIWQDFLEGSCKGTLFQSSFSMKDLGFLGL